jgi:hypothetical protein
VAVTIGASLLSPCGALVGPPKSAVAPLAAEFPEGRGVVEVVAAQGAVGPVDAVEDRADVPDDEERDGDDEEQGVDDDDDPACAEVPGVLHPPAEETIPIEQLTEKDQAEQPEDDRDDVHHDDVDLITPGAVRLLLQVRRFLAGQPDYGGDHQRQDKADPDKAEGDRAVRHRRQRALGAGAGQSHALPREAACLPRSAASLIAHGGFLRSVEDKHPAPQRSMMRTLIKHTL